MNVTVANFGTIRREWVAITSTFITASSAGALQDSEENSQFASLGSRLEATLVENFAGYWIVGDGTVDGQPLNPALRMLVQEHWVLLPLDDPNEVRDALTPARLGGARWSFGLSNREPMSDMLYFMEDGSIGGYWHANERSWRLEDGALLILSEAGTVTWKFEVALLQDGLLRLVGFAQQDWVECAILDEKPALASAVSDAGAWRAWISVRPTALVAPCGGAGTQEVARWVPLATRLVARLTGETAEGWEIADAMAGGALVPRGLRLALGAHWVLLPAEQLDDPQQGMALLQESRLVGKRFSFGLSKREPMSTAFYFMRDGKIGGYKHFNEQFWELRDGALLVLSSAGLVTWKFEVALEDEGRLQLVGYAQQDWAESAMLTELPPAALGEAPLDDLPMNAVRLTEGAGNGVKMIIWDLDDTFWQGTLAEGEVTPIARNLDLIKAMTERGIINSICSKNDYDAVKQRLTAMGMWDYFVFPRIAYEPKGALIKDIIQSAQLRPESVLFVDDNTLNIEEALHYNPGLQVCLPDALEALAEDARCAGHADPARSRLEWYRVLERKNIDRGAKASGNLDFLRQSGIRLSFHHDVFAVFDRLHVLVNRTNQLNFTKNRWPEDEAEARAELRAELTSQFNSHCGYIKVADNYGTYGICGFYVVREGECHHFLFSCRIMNMGVEQLVWQKIGRPHYNLSGSVASSLGDVPDWIEVVEDADVVQKAAKPSMASICIRGACDLAMMTHYLRLRFNPIEEFTFPYMGWGIHPVARAVALYDEVNQPAGKALLAKMPGISPRRFDSAVHTGEADIYVLSFSSEVFTGLYKSKSTGMVLPLDCWPAARQDFAKISYQDIREPAQQVGLTEAQWDFLREEFEFRGVLDLMQLNADVRTTFEKLRGKTVVVLMLSTEIGKDKWILNEYKKINSMVRPLTEAFGFHAIEMGALVRSVDDLVDPNDGGVHFKREVYQRLARQISDIIEAAEEPAHTVRRLSA